MEQMAYGLGIKVELSLQEAEERVRIALAEEGFGILTEIDVQATLREKLGLERAPYKILGACNPPLAARALEADRDIGLLLPCNVVVYETEGATVVAAMEPSLMASMSATGELASIAGEARARLVSALERVEAGAA
jgi:uncharacterized protein (DUF302 family)